MKIDYAIDEVVPYVNWIYFFHAWGLNGKPQQERDALRAEADEMLCELSRRYQTHAVFQLFRAHSEDDDIVLEENNRRLPMLRQQNQVPSLCLADFIRTEVGSDRIGLFAATVDSEMEQEYATDDYLRLLVQTLADRLAEATVERIHEEVRKKWWGYAPEEKLSMKQMHREEFQGIRPAVGYPSLPDVSLNFLLDDILDMKQIGIRLTENGMMRPHASVSGLMLSHPQARYFEVGRVGEDQLQDYARRRGMSVEQMRKFLKQ
ncbi:MAG: 5-methyltetrahydrofolate--homocysteine methyltransferase [Prevotella sp.]|nr:5-methyltetrahydrofolate--homocysteine methyltransferase [Prevotella sp.]